MRPVAESAPTSGVWAPCVSCKISVSDQKKPFAHAQTASPTGQSVTSSPILSTTPQSATRVSQAKSSGSHRNALRIDIRSAGLLSVTCSAREPLFGPGLRFGLFVNRSPSSRGRHAWRKIAPSFHRFSSRLMFRPKASALASRPLGVNAAARPFGLVSVRSQVFTGKRRVAARHPPRVQPPEDFHCPIC